jgi:hypothetical protein
MWRLIRIRNIQQILRNHNDSSNHNNDNHNHNHNHSHSNDEHCSAKYSSAG